MMVFGLALLLSVPFITRAQTSIIDLRSTSQMVEIRNSVENIENAANTVNAAGYPSKMTFFVKIPENVDNAYVLDSAMIYSVRTADGRANITRSFDFNVSGDLPADDGRKRISVKARRDDVRFKVVP